MGPAREGFRKHSWGRTVGATRAGARQPPPRATEADPVQKPDPEGPAPGRRRRSVSRGIWVVARLKDTLPSFSLREVEQERNRQRFRAAVRPEELCPFDAKLTQATQTAGL